MTFLEHLEELRWTLVRSAIAIAVAMVACFIAKDFVFDPVVLAPKEPPAFITYRAFCCIGPPTWAWATRYVRSEIWIFTLQNISMSGQFFTHLMVSFVAGSSSPFRTCSGKCGASSLRACTPRSDGSFARCGGFCHGPLPDSGVGFGYFMLAPLSIQFFGTYQVSASVQNTVALDSYIAMVTSVTLWTGVVFELALGDPLPDQGRYRHTGIPAHLPQARLRRASSSSRPFSPRRMW
jgi:sec-independent protein translocase protein TatC